MSANPCSSKAGSINNCEIDFNNLYIMALRGEAFIIALLD